MPPCTTPCATPGRSRMEAPAAASTKPPTAAGVRVVIDRRDPKVLYAAMYDAMRYPWKIQDGGPGSGIYKTTDGGKIWEKLESGLPKGTLGRIGIDICRTHPEVLYAVVDNFNPYAGPPRGRGGSGTEEIGRAHV